MAALVNIVSAVVVVILVSAAGPSAGLRCHQCSGVTDPHYCSRVVHCAAGEECHTEKVIGEDSAVFYNSGCQTHSGHVPQLGCICCTDNDHSKHCFQKYCKLCQLAAKGRRSELHVCEGCCGTDLCNSELCLASNSSSSSPGVQCYQCDEVDSPPDCNNRITCADGEQCIVQKYANDKTEVKYSLGCETRSRCDLLHKLGRRSTNICNECCDTPGCNRHLCFQDSSNQTTTPSSTNNSSCMDQTDIDCKLANDSDNICALRTLAAQKYCQKFCGYCSADGSTVTTMPPPTGTTEDPCKDSAEIDCKQMNDTLHMCEKKDSPATLLYCPKFCKLCTPSVPACSDSTDVDCKLANDTQNICARRTLAATKYCQKFCGYCSADGSTRPTLPPPTGVTEDPCKDSGDLDCQQMNDTLHICAKKDSPPTLLYCPKFCQLCTPACADSPDIDCKLADDAQDICAKRSLVAVNHCQKFCGYCNPDGSTRPTPPPPTGTTEDPCKDSGDMDCKQMDDALHICAKKDSAPTQLYCPKYCGLC